ncbi:unnamed protein product [Urochloa humidicola]
MTSCQLVCCPRGFGTIFGRLLSLLIPVAVACGILSWVILRDAAEKVLPFSCQVVSTVTSCFGGATEGDSLLKVQPALVELIMPCLLFTFQAGGLVYPGCLRYTPLPRIVPFVLSDTI